MEAVVMKRKEVVQLLIEAGAHMDLCNAVVIINNFIENTIFYYYYQHFKNGETALQMGNRFIIEVLSILTNNSFNSNNLQKCFISDKTSNIKRKRSKSLKNG